MSTRAGLCILCLLLPGIYCGVSDIDSWPFSSYPMYSYAFQLERFQYYSLCVVTPDETVVEVRTSDILWPLNFQRLQVKVKDLRAQPEGPQKLQRLLEYYLGRLLEDFQKSGRVFPARVQLRSISGRYQGGFEDRRAIKEGYEVVAEVVNRD